MCSRSNDRLSLSLAIHVLELCTFECVLRIYGWGISYETVSFTTSSFGAFVWDREINKWRTKKRKTKFDEFIHFRILGNVKLVSSFGIRRIIVLHFNILSSVCSTSYDITVEGGARNVNNRFLISSSRQKRNISCHFLFPFLTLLATTSLKVMKYSGLESWHVFKHSRIVCYVFQHGHYVCNTNSNSDGSAVCFLFS